MHTGKLSYGPRLVADPTGALRAALLVSPPGTIDKAQPLAGEPNAVHWRAVSQLNVLIKTLKYLNCEVTLLDAHTEDPFANAVVDAAVVFENGAVMLRPSALTRRPEAVWLESEFSKRDFPIGGHIAAPGLLDGSDVLMAGNRAFIGLSKRSNAIGRAGFAQIARAHGYNTVEVALAPGVASLRSVAGIAARDTVVLAPSTHVDHAAFSGFQTIVAPVGEELGAGVLPVGERHVVADVRYPRVNQQMRKSGVMVDAIDLYEFTRIGISPSMLVLDIKRA